jgi:hypothetical protein
MRSWIAGVTPNGLSDAWTLREPSDEPKCPNKPSPDGGVLHSHSVIANVQTAPCRFGELDPAGVGLEVVVDRCFDWVTNEGGPRSESESRNPFENQSPDLLIRVSTGRGR